MRLPDQHSNQTTLASLNSSPPPLTCPSQSQSYLHLPTQHEPVPSAIPGLPSP
ncbi:hypothetical protein BKA81DRAFT_153220 [Phyllosticta paracitricarpa]